MTGFDDYMKNTCGQLKQKLRSRSLKVSGLKADLVRRLEEDDEKNSDIAQGGDVDRHGTNHISKDNAGLSSKAEIPVSLETLSIYLKCFRLEDSDQYSDCKMVQQLFELVWYSKNIRFKIFGAKIRGEKSQCDRNSKAERSYDLHLKTRATDLAIECSQTKMCDRSEKAWEYLLSPQVFRSFIQSADDMGYTANRTHHW